VPGKYDRFVFYDPPEKVRDFLSWLPHEKFIAQRGSDVGQRMDNAIRYLLENGAKKAVITGADIPDLTGKIIMQAFEMLDKADVVVGPAHDGGYYLIGMKSTMPELFRNIPWSTKEVFSEQSGRLRIQEKATVSFLYFQILIQLTTLGMFKIGARAE
jgi:rSAM/selenodomain-associated transferase 1